MQIFVDLFLLITDNLKMLTVFRIFIVLLIFSFTVFAQNAPELNKFEQLKKTEAEISSLEDKKIILEDRRDALRRELVSVEANDEAEARKMYIRAVKLFPDGILDEIIPLPDGESFSVYPFIEISEFYFAPRLAYVNGSLKFLNDESGGLIYNLGGTPLETVGEQSREFKALAKFKTPQNKSDISSSFSVDGFSFVNSTPAVVGNTYLIRAFNLKGKDGIYVLHIKRKYSDGSIVFFVKLLKNSSFSNTLQTSDSAEKEPKQNSVPKTEYEKIEIKLKIEAALVKKGFTNIIVDVTNFPFTLRGTYPKHKIAEIMQIAMEINGGFPIKNEMIGK